MGLKGSTGNEQANRENIERLIFYIEKIVESMGYPAAAAKIYAYLVIRGEPATIDEIAAEAGVGRSTAATNLKLLEHDGLVYSVKRGRRKLFYARSALPYVMMYPAKVLKEYVEPLLEMLERLRDRGQHYKQLHQEVKAFLEAAMKAMQVFEAELRKRGTVELLARSENRNTTRGRGEEAAE